MMMGPEKVSVSVIPARPVLLAMPDPPGLLGSRTVLVIVIHQAEAKV